MRGRPFCFHKSLLVVANGEENAVVDGNGGGKNGRALAVRKSELAREAGERGARGSRRSCRAIAGCKGNARGLGGAVRSGQTGVADKDLAQAAVCAVDDIALGGVRRMTWRNRQECHKAPRRTN